MALIQKINPVALDKEIDCFQVYLFNKLGFTDWESYHRAYTNPKGRGNIPEVFDVDGEYREVFYNDNFSLTSFFLASPVRTPNDTGVTEVTVSIIFSANLVDLYPTITGHRADEELKNSIQFASEIYSGADTFTFIGIEETIDNVYREFIKDNIEFEDMSDQHCVRFNYRVKYTPDCT